MQGRGAGVAGVVSQAVDSELRRKIQALQQQVSHHHRVGLGFRVRSATTTPCGTAQPPCLPQLQLLDETQKLRLSESHSDIAKSDAAKWEACAVHAQSQAKSLEAALRDMKGVADQRVRDAVAASELKVAALEKVVRETREQLQSSVIQAQAATEHAAANQRAAASLQLRIDELLRSDTAPIIASLQEQLVAAAAKQKQHADAAVAAQSECARVSRELSSSHAALAVAHADACSNAKLLQDERDSVRHLRAQLSAALQRAQNAEAELESEHAAHGMVEKQLRSQKSKIETTNNINRLNLLIRIAGVSHGVFRCFGTHMLFCRGVQAGGHAEGREARGSGAGGGHRAVGVQHQCQRRPRFAKQRGSS